MQGPEPKKTNMSAAWALVAIVAIICLTLIALAWIGKNC